MNSSIHCVILIPNTHELKGSMLGYGGAENQILGQLRQFETRENIRIKLLTQYSQYIPQTNRIEIIQIAKPKKSYVFASLKYILLAYRYLRKIHKVEKIDIIQIHMTGLAAIPAILAKKKLKIPTIIKISGKISEVREDKSQLNILNRLIKGVILTLRNWIIKNVDYFQTVNQQMQYDLINHYKIPENRTFLIPNGIETKNFHPCNATLSNLPTKFGFVGRFEPIKNLPFLLKVMRDLVQIKPDSLLLLYGKGTHQKIIEQFINTNKLHENIIIKGFEKDRSKIYGNIDIFVIPSKNEGISNSLLEAMASGIPIVASNVPGNSDVITDGYNGLLFDIDSQQDLLKKLLYFPQNTEMALKMRKNALSDIRTIYSMDVIVDQLINIYNKIRL